jgi:molybdenum cofactor biosynthesis protein B
MADRHEHPLEAPAPRVIVATVALGRASVKEDVAQIVIDEIDTAKLHFARSVTVNREKQFIQQLVSHVATSNEADAIILVGGVGIGPRDFTCEAIEDIADRRIEGFGEAFRQLLREELHAGPSTLLARASAAICNKCVIVALPRQPEPLRRAMRSLVLPTLRQAVRTAAGQGRHDVTTA